MKCDPMFWADFYKISHYLMGEKGTEKLYSTLTPRHSRIEGINEVVFFGLQGFIKDYIIEQFNVGFFKVKKSKVIKRYKRLISCTLGDDCADSSHIEALHDLGYLPIRIKAVKEGTLIPMRVPVFTIESTDKNFYWLPLFMETFISANIWKVITSTTIVKKYRDICEKWAEKTCDSKDHIQWQCHNFSYRGMSGNEDATTTGAGHLLYFTGTDTIPSIPYLEDYYGANVEKELVGASVKATEHSIQCGYQDDLRYFKRMLEIDPTGIVSIVSDGYDYFNVIGNILPELKNDIMTRSGKLVIRPDCYDDKTEILTNNGWKLFKDLNRESDLVAQFDNGNINFTKPLNYIDEHYCGEMINFKSIKNKIDLLVTPNHRMLRFNNEMNRFEVKEAKDIKYYYNYNLPVSGLKQGIINTLTSYDKLMIAFQADGRCKIKEDRNVGILGGKYILEFQFAKQRKIDKLKEICEQGGFEYKISKPTSNELSKSHENWNDQSTFYVYMDEKPLKMFYEWVDFTDKSYIWCREFINEVSNWDASIRDNDRIKFDNTNKSDAEIVQVASVMSGYRSTFTESVDNRSNKFNNINTVHIVPHRSCVEGQAVKKEVISYDGRIYCVTVPSGMLVIRRNEQIVISGNSGNPIKIICGDKESTEELVKKGSVEDLWDIFGGTINSKGYKVLDSHVGLIYGDSITPEYAEEILKQLEEKGFASSNIVFGVGSYSLGYYTRDTFAFAMKATYTIINGEERFIFKDPKTDNGIKKSQRGMVAVLQGEDGKIYFKDGLNAKDKEALKDIDLLQDVFVDGKMVREQTLAEIREIVLR